jgi:hypothetical protein
MVVEGTTAEDTQVTCTAPDNADGNATLEDDEFTVRRVMFFKQVFFYRKTYT